jgi:hypothetical protein
MLWNSLASFSVKPESEPVLSIAIWILPMLAFHSLPRIPRGWDHRDVERPRSTPPGWPSEWLSSHAMNA